MLEDSAERGEHSLARRSSLWLARIAPWTLSYYDFQQVSRAKTIFELMSAGVGPQRVRESLSQLRWWLPDVETSLWQLSLLEQDGDMLVRLQDGRVAEPTGQLRFDFMRPDEAVASLSIHDGWTADDWFAKAVEFEDLGQPAEAAAAYRKAIESEPNDPVLHFNLANALYGCGDQRGAIDSFRAAVNLDPTYIEAWNNLGSACAKSAETMRQFRPTKRL